MDKIVKMDEAVIRWATVAYLWLLDWTGAYVATTGMGLYSVAAGLAIIERGRFTWFDGVLYVVMLFWFGPVWLQQHHGLFESFNRNALWWQGSRHRMFIQSFNMGFIVVDVYKLNPAGIAGDVLLIAWFYLCCATIRDREPKEFKLGRALRPAMGGAR